MNRIITTFLVCVTAGFLCIALASAVSAAPQEKGSSASALAGTWETQGRNGPVTMDLRPDGSGTMAGENIHWQYNLGILVISRAGGEIHMYNAKLASGSLTLSSATMKQPSVFHRVGDVRKPVEESGPAGSWEVPGPQGVIHLNLKRGGAGDFGGGPIHWTFSQKVLSLTGPNGRPIMYNAALAGDSMTLSGGGLEGPLEFHRAGGAPKATAGGEEHEEKETGLVGNWQGNTGIMRLNADGTATFNGTNFRYTAENGILTLTGSDGSLPMPYTLSGDSLQVTVQGQQGTLRRVHGGSAGKAGGGTPMEMAGQWCSFSSSSNYSYSHQACFTLRPDGTYMYSSGGGSSGAAGSAYGEGNDSGTWSATGSTLTAISRSTGSHTYRLEKRNNKNNDPMLCLDGSCFATATRKPPWPY
jgi:hypothetical protein